MNKNPRACAECQKRIEEFKQALSAAEEVELALSQI